MKKRFTLMMMVLCILMSIPLKMMAQTVTYDEITVVSHYNQGNNWGPNSNFNFTTTDGKIYTCVLKDVTAENVWFRIVKNKSDMQWGPNNSSNSSKEDLVLTSSYQQAYESKTHEKSFKIENAQGSTYTITWDNETNQIKCVKEGSSSGSGTGNPTVEWDTENTNRLKGRVYSQGFYLAGSFFTFSGVKGVEGVKDDRDKVTYDDAVFKFQQQNDVTIKSGNDNVVYEEYKVEIPASLKAHAQVMYVDEFGNIKNIFGPGTYSISRTCPNTDKSTEWLEAHVNVCNPITQENSNYWNFKSRNESETEFSDGMYNLYIAVDAKTHTVKKWMIEHDSDKRVAYFISDAPNATAMPVYDAFDLSQHNNKFSNKFYASVNFSADYNYYVISNYLTSKDYDSWTKHDYDTKTNGKDYATTNKLFLQGNGGSAYNPGDNTNEFSPNEKPMPGGDLGNIVVEYNPSQGHGGFANTAAHLGIRGQVKQAEGSTKIKSVSMVGDAIPGTLKVDEITGKEVWDYTSKAAEMTYDDVEQCYTTTIVTTVGEGKKHFRFVGNHDPKINWFEDTDGTEPNKMAKTPLSDTEAKGHTADAKDPNKVNYTKEGEFSEDKYNIIWNRPAGRWTVRLYFYTRNVDGVAFTDYYYTISPCKDLELRDCVNIVYKSEDNKRVIQNVGEYKFLRTWSDEKAWKVSKDIDIYVVDQLSADKTHNAVTLHLNLLDSKDKSGKYNVIPAGIGVILGTKKEAADIEGGAVFHKRTSLTSLNTVVVPMYEYNANEETSGTSVTSLLLPLTYARVVPTSETVDGKVTYNYLFGAGKGKSVGIDCENENDFFMGFWISNGKGNFYSNSCYLSIDKETADILGVGIRNDQFNPVTHAKMVPGVIFDFANVGGTTGINEVVNQSTKLNDGKYYTLNGQQVEKPTAGGIYIHNGRKFVVK